MFDFCASKLKHGCNTLRQEDALAVDGAALHRADTDLAAGLHLDGGQVRGGLDQAGDVGAHRRHAVGNRNQGVDQIAGRAAVDGASLFSPSVQVTGSAWK